MPPTAKPKFFPTAATFRSWLEKHHASETELWVAYYKKDSGRTSVTYSESVDQAICFGWIDGVRVSIDGISYRIRFTPRKPRSIWSTINIGKANELTKQGLMHAAGMKCFEARTENRSEIYSFERKGIRELDLAYEKKLAANKKAKSFFDAQIPSYKRVIVHWVMSAKREETRLHRLDLLIASSEKGLYAPPYLRAQKPRKAK
jgi:uncharacterized protein YdeI (YjbR/CyaY-like superfamily)